PAESLLNAGQAAVAAGRHDRAQAYLEAAREAGRIEDASALRRQIDRSLGLERMVQIVRPADEDGVFGDAELEVDQGSTITFVDVGGLEEVKKSIHRSIILPFQRQDLYLKYKRGVGGAVLLFGPPGCGKTMLARATAGECGL